MRLSPSLPALAALAFVAASVAPQEALAQATDYEVVPSWPTFPPGVFFGMQGGWPDQEARDQGVEREGEEPMGPPRYGQGVSGIAIDDDDNIYVFNRGIQTVLVFDRQGRFLRGGGERDMDGEPIAGGWLHSGEVDWDGYVWVVERNNQRILKLTPDLDRVVMQLGTTGEAGNDATHFDNPSGISVLRSGRLLVTDGYGNNRIVLYSPDGKFLKQVAAGNGGPDATGTGPGEFDLPHQAAVDAEDNLYVVDRENRRIQVFDSDLNYQRELTNEGWYPWDIAISREGDDGVAYIADHATEEVHKISLDDGRILATWGGPGRGPGEFDWVHGMAVDSRGAVYASDTYGQRVQKFVPVDAP